MTRLVGFGRFGGRSGTTMVELDPGRPLKAPSGESARYSSATVSSEKTMLALSSQKKSASSPVSDRQYASKKDDIIDRPSVSTESRRSTIDIDSRPVSCIDAISRWAGMTGLGPVSCMVVVLLEELLFAARDVFP